MGIGPGNYLTWIPGFHSWFWTLAEGVALRLQKDLIVLMIFNLSLSLIMCTYSHHTCSHSHERFYFCVTTLASLSQNPPLK